MAYSPAQPAWGPPHSNPPEPTPRPPRRKHRLAWTLATLVGVLVLGLVLNGAVYLHRQGWTESPRGYTIVETATRSADASWTFTLPLPDVGSLSRTDWAGTIDIYSDPALTRPVTTFHASASLTPLGPRLTVSPLGRLLPAVDNLPPTSSYWLGSTGWPTGTYYIAERRDLLGGRLDQPRVHVYTVDNPAAPAAPAFTMAVTDGVPTLTWDSVAGAAAYVVLQATTADPGYEIIGTAPGDATTWSATAQDLAYSNTRQYDESVTEANREFRATGANGETCGPQDETYQGPTPPAWDTSGLAYPGFAVVAAGTGGSISLPDVQDGKTVITDTPVATAARTFAAQAEAAGGAATYYPDQFPVTMGDCRTAFFPVIPQKLVSEEGTTRLTYAVTGTPLTGTLTGSDPDTAARVTALGQGLGLTPLVSLGTGEGLGWFSADEAQQYAPGRTPSTTAPDSPYTWNGSSDMVKYIAANLFAGEEAIDMSAYVGAADPLILDAAAEAVYQNPYLTDLTFTLGVYNNVLYAGYMEDAATRAAEAAALKAKVDQLALQLVNPEMDDRAKAKAINDYLAKHAVYNDAAASSAAMAMDAETYAATYRNSWNGIGVLIGGTGVCQSYAAAYKALADAVGLPSVTITGYADDSGTLHAWNKVSIGGTWWVIDSTWNSNIWEQIHGNIETYFLLTDAQAARTQVDGFVVDPLISSYATP